MTFSFFPARISPAKCQVAIWDEFGLETVQEALVQIVGGNAKDIPVWGKNISLDGAHMAMAFVYLFRGIGIRRGLFKAWLHRIGVTTLITFNDNSNFHSLASLAPNVRFIAIQNGWRFPLPEHSDPPLPRGSRYRSMLVAFGENDRQGYEELDIHFGRVVPAGSLKVSLAAPLDGVTEPVPEPEFDLCLVSSFRNSPGANMNLPGYAELRSDYSLMLRNFFKFVALNGPFNICLAMNSSIGDHDSQVLERQFFSEMAYGVPLTFRERNDETRSSYQCALASKVVVTSSSTLGIESLGLRTRPLLFSTSLMRRFQDTTAPNWVCPTPDSSSFFQKLKFALEVDNCEYWDSNSLRWAEFFLATTLGVSTLDVLKSMIAVPNGIDTQTSGVLVVDGEE